ncbi:flagellar basal-body MS-ring/collar protein FliF [Thermosulfuriphilus sp.]
MANLDPKQAFEQLKNLYQSLDRRQKLLGAALLLVTIGGLVALIFLNTQPEYRVLYKGLTQEDAAEIVSWLQKEKVPYRLVDGGATIKVPADRVYEVRLALARSGLPRGGGPGFELFDRTSLGTTEFVQHLNYQRALQGELARTISELEAVEEARVHLATPKESLFIEEQKEPTAAVVLKLKRGASLSRQEVKGIVHLVSHAVPGLKPENITVVDSSGKVLYQAEDPQEQLTQKQVAYQKTLENYYRQKIETMLAEVLGPGRAIARVAVDLDFDKEVFSEEAFDPDAAAIRSEQLTNELKTAKEEGGVPGVKGALDKKIEGNLGAASQGIQYQKSTAIKNYEISRVSRHREATPGRIKRLSVAVLIDGTYQEVTAEDGKGKIKKYVPRSPEEMAQFEKIVKGAIGYDPDRGDRVEVVNVPFSMEEERALPPLWLDVAHRLAKPFLNLVLIVLFFVIVVRPLLKSFLRRVEPEPVPAEGPQAIEGEAPEEIETEEPAALPRDLAISIVHSQPERAAILVRKWLAEEMAEEGQEKAQQKAQQKA